MQVATLFREATSLLDAGMEEGAHLKMSVSKLLFTLSTDPLLLLH